MEAETFKMNIFLTATGAKSMPSPPPSLDAVLILLIAGTKFVLLTSLSDQSADTVLQKVYEAYADAVMKNPFYTPEMPIRVEGFESKITEIMKA